MALTAGLAILPVHAMQPAQIQFVVVGDTGTGADGQYKVARAIDQVCSTSGGCTFALGLGDNIYERGAGSAVDQQFKDKFEYPYAPLKFPFFMTLGNHDQTLLLGGDGAAAWKGNYEVAYARNNLGKTKWIMPGRYYYADAISDDKSTSIRMVAYDGNPMRSYMISPDPYFWPTGTYNQQQARWVANALVQTTATWRFAFSHYPVKGNGLEPWYQRLLFPWFATHAIFAQTSLCGKADFIFSGHAHGLEVLNDSENCNGTHHVTSGSGSRLNARPPNFEYSSRFNTLEAKKYGFFFVRAEGKQLTLMPYTVDPATGETVRQRTFVYTRQAPGVITTSG